MKYDFELKWGLPLPDGSISKKISVKPLTIGAEIKAIDESDDFCDEQNIPVKNQGVVQTVAYWTHQLSVDGLSADKLTLAYLMDNLAGEDYAVILEAQEQLRSKYVAASDNPAAEAAAPSNTATSKPTETTDKP